jgi:hypothetical protein
MPDPVLKTHHNALGSLLKAGTNTIVPALFFPIHPEQDLSKPDLIKKNLHHQPNMLK